MTINNLKEYARRMDAKALPTDKFNVTMNRDALTYIGAFLSDRKASLEQSLSAPKISPKKRDKREYELSMVNEAIAALDNTVRL